MSEMLRSIKADLTSRRMLPLLVLLCVALAAAVAYGVLGGSSNAAAPRIATVPISVPPVPGPAVSSAPANPNAALAETTSGASFQHTGRMRDPFTPLPGSQVASTPSGSSSTGAGSSTGSGSSVIASGGAPVTGSSSSGTGAGSGGSSGASGSGSSTTATGSSPTPAGTSTPPAPAPSTIVTVYRVSATLQELSGKGAPVGRAQSFQDIKTLTPLPGSGDPLITPYLAGKGGRSIIFLLLRAPILHGGATCLPSPEDCLAIEVGLHRSEELRYLSSNGSVTAYRLTVTAMTPRTITLSAEKAREAQHRGLAIIRQRAARLTKALAGGGGGASGSGAKARHR